MVYWDTFSWEAFVSGVAILVAGWVGVRQVGIQRRQSELEALGLKAALWDRRMEIYDATTAYLGHIVLVGGVPGRSGSLSKMTPAVQLAVAFNKAVERSEFLMSPEARSRLLRLRDKAKRLGDIREDANIFYEPHQTPLQNEAAEIRAELVRVYNDVASIFGDDIRLVGSPPRPSGPAFRLFQDAQS